MQSTGLQLLSIESISPTWTRFLSNFPISFSTFEDLPPENLSHIRRHRSNNPSWRIALTELENLFDSKGQPVHNALQKMRKLRKRTADGESACYNPLSEVLNEVKDRAPVNGYLGE